MDFRGFDSSIVLIQRGGILMSTGNCSKSLTQAMVVGVMLVGRLGVSSTLIFVQKEEYEENNNISIKLINVIRKC